MKDNLINKEGYSHMYVNNMSIIDMQKKKKTTKNNYNNNRIKQVCNYVW